ncbi:Riboflavin biosynthesis protein RibBA [Pseudoalteromonas holothuriae]|uniref:GTP cyclohydrolase II n=1 Tax=Pseudoalteromonas holothuriae TaxID=2963714 RepID=A0ABM9GPJ4_9GAMM|nr:GTP cyclohydrolase II RibA [Pseudoalteromonas sp. CIP111951]CAH9067415.1 Riboflavin biosynthesis protein RibBA [Pseudoalteromonas sp. CIP111951]
MILTASTTLPTQLGSFDVKIYRNDKGEEITAICKGELEGRRDLPVRMHSACFTAETLGSLKCDCKQQLDFALAYIERHQGMVIYLPQEGRGIGLSNKIKAYALQEQGYDTIEANTLLNLPIDARTYDDAAQILQLHKLSSVRLLTNNPVKIKQLEELGVKVSGRVPVPSDPTSHAISYLDTKRRQMGHMLGDYHLQPQDCEIVANDRPFVHINFAIDGNANTSCSNGDALPVSCSADWQRVHELRQKYDAIAVGANTWLNDNPKLTVREEVLGRKPLRQPDRVIFSGKKSALLRGLNIDQANIQRSTFLVGQSSNVTAKHLTQINADSYQLALPLAQLRNNKVSSMLVEGGVTLIQSFIEQRLFDLITIYVRTTSICLAVNIATEVLKGIYPDQIEAQAFGDGILLSVAQPNLSCEIKAVQELAYE